MCVCVSGWKFGAVIGRSGAFPADCVHPVAPPGFLSLPLDRQAEPRGGAGQFAVSSAIAVAVASTAAAHEIDQTIEVRGHSFSVRLTCRIVFHWQPLNFRRFPLTSFPKEIWTRGPCRTANTTCPSLPRCSSGRQPGGRGETQEQTCTKHT